jgi:hypothetical protein
MASTSSLLPLLTFGFVVGTSDAGLAGLEAVESVLCAVLVVESVVAGEAGADVVCWPDWAAAGMVKQKHSNHAMEAETARAFIGDSDPERFFTLLNPTAKRLIRTTGSAALALSRRLTSVEGRFLRSLYAQNGLSTCRTGLPNKPVTRVMR